MALIKCPECGNEISDKCTVCIHCGYPLQAEDLKQEVKIGENKEIKEEKPEKTKFSKRENHIIGLMIGVVSIITIATSVAVPLGINYTYENLYKEIENEANLFDKDSTKLFEKNLEILPDSFRNVSYYKETFNEIKEELRHLNAHNHSNEDGELARSAFVTLQRIDQTEYWDLTNIFNTSKVVESYIFGVEWTTDHGQTLSLAYEGEDLYLTTDLPNAKEYDKNYYFYIRNNDAELEVGYENTRDEDDRFAAYYLYGPSYLNNTFYINCKCTYNSKIYSLRYNEF